MYKKLSVYPGSGINVLWRYKAPLLWVSGRHTFSKWSHIQNAKLQCDKGREVNLALKTDEGRIFSKVIHHDFLREAVLVSKSGGKGRARAKDTSKDPKGREARMVRVKR